MIVNAGGARIRARPTASLAPPTPPASSTTRSAAVIDTALVSQEAHGASPASPPDAPRESTPAAGNLAEARGHRAPYPGRRAGHTSSMSPARRHGPSTSSSDRPSPHSGPP